VLSVIHTHHHLDVSATDRAAGVDLVGIVCRWAHQNHALLNFTYLRWTHYAAISCPATWSVNFMSQCLAFSCPAISCPATWSVNFMSCIFMSCYLVRHFHVLQFHALQLGPSISCPAISCPSFSAPPTHSFLLWGDDLPECGTCQCPLTVKHILVECVDLKDVRNKHFVASSIKDVFDNVEAQKIVDFIKREFNPEKYMAWNEDLCLIKSCILHEVTIKLKQGYIDKNYEIRTPECGRFHRARSHHHWTTKMRLWTILWQLVRFHLLQLHFLAKIKMIL